MHLFPHSLSSQGSFVSWSTTRSTSSRCPVPTPAPSSPCPGWSWGAKSPSTVSKAATLPPSPFTPSLSMEGRYTGEYSSLCHCLTLYIHLTLTANITARFTLSFIYKIAWYESGFVLHTMMTIIKAGCGPFIYWISGRLLFTTFVIKVPPCSQLHKKSVNPSTISFSAVFASKNSMYRFSYFHTRGMYYLLFENNFLI